MYRLRSLRIQMFVGLVFAIATASLTSAQTPKPDPIRGREVAERVCVGCHAVEPGAQPRQADIPSFQAIANRPGRTAEFIIGALYYPHPPMPGIALESQEMRDVAAYILTFRKSE